MNYDNREVLFKSKDDVNGKSFMRSRNVEFIRHFSSKRFNSLTDEQKSSIYGELHIWQFGDSLVKLSKRYYGDYDNWVVIAIHNNTPTDYHIEPGQELSIPFPLYKAKSLYGL